jgi:hypothetical protein
MTGKLGFNDQTRVLMCQTPLGRMRTPAGGLRQCGTVRYAGAIAAGEGVGQTGKIPAFAGQDFAEGFLKSLGSSHYSTVEFFSKWRTV